MRKERIEGKREEGGRGRGRKEENRMQRRRTYL